MGCFKLDISDKHFTTLKVVHNSLKDSANTYADAYLFGFNGKMKDDEWHNTTGSTYDYGFRIYDSRLVRFLSVDPLTKSYPWYTPYQFAGNKPIACIDLDGLEEVHNYYVWDEKSKGYVLELTTIDNTKLKSTLQNHYKKGTSGWESGKLHDFGVDPIHAFTRLTRPRGIMIWGTGDGSGTPGRIADSKDIWGTFDFAAFKEIMDLINISLKDKSDNSIKTTKSRAKKRMVKYSSKWYFNDYANREQETTNITTEKESETKGSEPKEDKIRIDTTYENWNVGSGKTITQRVITKTDNEGNLIEPKEITNVESLK